MTERDQILEAAALAIEEPSLSDLAGMLSRTKKGQREYEIRRAAIVESRRRCAEIIRAMKSGRGLDPLEQLRRLATLPADGPHHDLYLVDAWPLAWKGWLTIECTIVCNSNSCPPETRYRIALTDAGRAMIADGENVPVAKEG